MNIKKNNKSDFNSKLCLLKKNKNLHNLTNLKFTLDDKKMYHCSACQAMSYIYSNDEAQPIYNTNAGFTLTELLLACVIVGVISALVLPVFVSKYQEKAFERGFEREIKSLNNALDTLAITENKDYFKTMMYVSETPETYEENSGKFLKKYLKLSKYCGDNNRDCFANVYYEYKDKDKKVYNPEFKGACASLKNGSSICLTPQISANSPQVLIDINGKKGPNVLGKDLRLLALNLKMRTALNKTTQDVLTTEASYELNNTINCQQNPQSLACCEYQGITDENKSYCCKYSELNNNTECCKLGISDENASYCCAKTEFTWHSACCSRKGGKYIDNIGCIFINSENDNWENMTNKCNELGTRAATESDYKYIFDTHNLGTLGLSNYQYYWASQGECRIVVMAECDQESLPAIALDACGKMIGGYGYFSKGETGCQNHMTIPRKVLCIGN
ncbi:type II secretion system protein [bacterium]|nr:type II secretion system protein [bacterium]